MCLYCAVEKILATQVSKLIEHQFQRRYTQCKSSILKTPNINYAKMMHERQECIIVSYYDTS